MVLLQVRNDTDINENGGLQHDKVRCNYERLVWLLELYCLLDSLTVIML